MKLVYIAGPLTTSGDEDENVRVALRAAQLVLDLHEDHKWEVYPYVPHYTKYLHTNIPRSYNCWMDMALAVISRSDIVWRLPGLSMGADAEVQWAMDHGTPVVYSLDELKALLAAEAEEGEHGRDFEDILDEMSHLHELKRQDYSPGMDEYANIRSSEGFGVPGWIGALVRLGDKVSRLRTFVTRGGLTNEGVEDTMLDLANYAVISLLLYRKTKTDGDDSGS